MGVALEVARTFVENPGLTLPAPVTFLLNGGEEPVLPAAHGFITQSRFVKDLGAFINLESTGPGGPDIIFQYSGMPAKDNLEMGSEPAEPLTCWQQAMPVPRATELCIHAEV